MKKTTVAATIQRVNPAAVALTLALVTAVLQLAPGARFSKTGEQITSGIPAAAVLLAIGIVSVWVTERRIAIPRPNLWQGLFFASFALGILGVQRVQIPAAAKDVVQLGIYIFAAPYLARHLFQDKRCANLFLHTGGAVAVILPILEFSGLLSLLAPGLSHVKYAIFVSLAAPFLPVLAGRQFSAWKGCLLAQHGILVGVTFDHGGLLIAWLVGICGTALVLSSNRRLAATTLAACAAAVVLGFAPLTNRNHTDAWEVFRPRYDQSHLKRFYIDSAAAMLAPRYMPFGGGPGRYKKNINTLKLHRAAIPHPEDTKVQRDGTSQLLVQLVESGAAAPLALIMLLGFAGLSGTDHPVPEDSRRRIIAAAAGMALFAALAAASFSLVLSQGVGLWIGVLIGAADCGRHRTAERFPGAFLAVPAVALLLCIGIAFAVNTGNPHDETPSVMNRWARTTWFNEDPQTWTKLQIVRLPDLLTDSEPGGAEETGSLHMEAEDVDKTPAGFLKIPDTEASGGHALAIPVHAAKGVGAAQYSSGKIAPGTYELYARVYWTDGCSNSLRFSVGNVEISLTSDIYNKWHLLHSPRKIRITDPPQTLSIHNLENGVRIDYWGLRPVAD